MFDYNVALPEMGDMSPSGPRGRRLHAKWVALVTFSCGLFSLAMAVLHLDDREGAICFAVGGIGSLAVGRVFLNRTRPGRKRSAPTESAAGGTGGTPVSG